VTPGVVQPTGQLQGSARLCQKLTPLERTDLLDLHTGFFRRRSSGNRRNGNVYLAGTADIGLPIPAGSTPFQSTNKGQNIAILKLNNNGLQFSTEPISAAAG